jgi:septal ring factor EnvC (AmiA/AmiB activator)
MPKRTLLTLLLSLFMLLSLPGLSSCTFDDKEYEDLLVLREEYLTQIAELRQEIETMNRNITVTYQELETLRARLAEEEKDRGLTVEEELPKA